MKPSRYNVITDSDNNNKLIFNSTSAALAEIPPEVYPVIHKLLFENRVPESDKEREFYGQLKMGKYLVEDELDETVELKVENRTQRFGNSTFLLTIAPTLACNFKCDYCFESPQNARMDEKTAAALLQFSEKWIRNSEELLISWFGGEPTLSLSILERLQDGFRELTEKHDTVFRPASIITNGYLLDAKVSERLKNAGVTDAQVTLDGPRRVHDSRRKLHSGKGTFDRIVHNLAEASDILRIAVRINIDRDNHDVAFEVLELLEKKNILSRVNVYFAQVNSSEGICADMKNKCLSTEEFSWDQVRLYEKLLERGIRQIEYPMLAPGGHCGADSDGAFVVDPDGNLFKCWEELCDGKESSVGSIFTDSPEGFQKANLYKYLSWDPFEKAECIDCNILPICMGGCPHHGMQENNKNRGSCISWKHNLKEMLILRHRCEPRKEVRT